jgi:hypothetical protein
MIPNQNSVWLAVHQRQTHNHAPNWPRLARTTKASNTEATKNRSPAKSHLTKLPAKTVYPYSAIVNSQRRQCNFLFGRKHLSVLLFRPDLFFGFRFISVTQKIVLDKLLNL